MYASIMQNKNFPDSRRSGNLLLFYHQKNRKYEKKEKTGAVFSFFVLRRGNILPSPQSLSLK